MAGKAAGGDRQGKGDRAPGARIAATRSATWSWWDPPDPGKTTLVETLLVSAGVLNRAGSTVDGTTVTDFDEAEQRQQRSVGLALAPLVHDGVEDQPPRRPGLRRLRR